ncbi:hypothetical protein HN51_052657 [Arachis hypogaea]
MFEEFNTQNKKRCFATTRLRHARHRWRELSRERRIPSTPRFAAAKTTTATLLSRVGSSAADHRIDLSLESCSSAARPPQLMNRMSEKDVIQV